MSEECPTTWVRARRIGRARAYNHYQCRCTECVAWRNSYDRERWEIKNRTEEYKRRKS